MNDIKFRASSVGKCAVELYRRAKYPEEFREMPSTNPMELFLRMGHTTQAAVASYLRICGVIVEDEEMEVTKDYGTFSVVGHIDGVIKGESMTAGMPVSGTETLLECKAVKSKNFSPLWTSPHLWSSKYPHYKAQAQMYMELSGLRDTAMVFIDRDNHKDNMIHGIKDMTGACASYSETLRDEYDLHYVQMMLTRLGSIAAAIEADEIPTCDEPKYCYHCQSHHVPMGSIRSGKGRVMETGERQNLMAEAMKAVKGAG